MAERILDEETKKALFGMMPFGRDGVAEFTPFLLKNAEIDEQYKSVYKIRPFNAAEKKTANTLLKDFANSDENLIYETARTGVIGWENVFDLSTGRELQFLKDEKDECASKDCFMQIPQSVVSGIFIFRVKISGLLDIERLSLRS